jgi:hypothetical protein
LLAKSEPASSLKRFDIRVEAPGVEAVFPKKDRAIDCGLQRACLRSGEIQILDSTGNVERVIPFDDANRKL